MWKQINAFFRSVSSVAGTIVWVGLLAPFPADADRLAVYTVRGVSVDMTAGDAAQARELALIRGQKAAYDRLLARLTVATDSHKRPSLSDAQIAQLVRGIEIENEKTSPVRYIADLTVSFKPEAVQRLLGQHGMAFSETISKPVLIIPVYEEGRERLLWEDRNPWLMAWRDRAVESTIVPMVVPLADLGDFAAMTPSQALQADPGSFKAMARRYDIVDSLVVRARLKPGSAWQRDSLDIALSRHGSVVSIPTHEFSVTAQPGEDRASLFARGVARVVTEVENSWKTVGLRRANGRPLILQVEVPLRVLADWVALEKSLASIPVVSKVSVLSFSRRRALIKLHFFGTVDTLRVALAQSRLLLQANGDTWSLRREGRS